MEGSVGPAVDSAALAQLVRGAGPVVALTGAGISVPSGIPDFRSPGSGMWENVNPMEVAHIDAWRGDPQRFWSFYAERFQTLGDKRPNGAHEALVELEKRGLLSAVITQNIDMLHRKAGTQTLVEVHGSIASSSCETCGAGFALDVVIERMRGADGGVPACDCGQPLKPDVVLFGEYLPPEPLGRAMRFATDAGLLLCVGSSLEVFPVAQLPGVTLANGGAVAIVTQGPTAWDDRAAVKLAGDVEHELQALIAAL